MKIILIIALLVLGASCMPPKKSRGVSWQWCFSDAVCTLPEKCNFILAVCRDPARDEYFGKDQNSFAPQLGPPVCPKSCPPGQKCVQGVCISSSG